MCSSVTYIECSIVTDIEFSSMVNYSVCSPVTYIKCSLASNYFLVPAIVLFQSVQISGLKPHIINTLQLLTISI